MKTGQRLRPYEEANQYYPETKISPQTKQRIIAEDSDGVSSGPRVKDAFGDRKWGELPKTPKDQAFWQTDYKVKEKQEQKALKEQERLNYLQEALQFEPGDEEEEEDRQTNG